MAAIELTPAQRKEKRGEAHHLDPVVMIGAEGLTPSVLKEAEVAIRSHGLIKVRVLSDDRAVRESLLQAMADQLGAAPVQHIGKLLVLWRPVEDRKPVERAEPGSAPRVVKILKFSKTGTHRPQIKRVTVLGNERVTAGGSVKRARKRPASIKKQAV